MAKDDGDQCPDPAALPGPPVGALSEDIAPDDAFGVNPLLKGHLVTPPIRDAPTCGHVDELRQVRRENELLRRRNRALTRKYISVKTERDVAMEVFERIRDAVVEAAATVLKVKPEAPKLPGEVKVEGMMQVHPRISPDATKGAAEVLGDQGE